MKRTWSILKEVIGKKNDKSAFPQTFYINNKSVVDTSEIAEGFNNYFSQIGLETGRNVPSTKKKYSDFLPINQNSRSMFIEPVTQTDTINSCRKLKSKTTTGHDEISTKLLKETIPIITDPITHIINMSLSAGIVPDDMKVAKVIPIFKSSDPKLLKNYRPISLLTAFSKLLEKIMYDKVISYLNANKLLYEHQYGFRSGHSTIHPIIHLLNHCSEATNKPNPDYTLAIFCDLSKAFDVIDHRILLQKLSAYGIRGLVNKWFASYLTDRCQYVHFETNSSSRQVISCGVPQGSILGPLLYLIFVNDIHKSCDSNILSFADDTTLYLSHSDIASLYSNANRHINNLYDWFCANKLSLNAQKNKYIVIRPKHKQCDFSLHKLCINGTPLNRIGQHCEETSAKFLGIYIDEYLTWHDHIKHVNRKMARAMFAIKQVKYLLPYNTLRNLYYALVHSHLSYAIVAWGNADRTITRKTMTLQKRAIRSINKASYNSDTEPLFSRSQILKLEDLYQYQSILFMYDYANKHLPTSFNSMFPYNRDIQTTHLTRQSDLLAIPRSLSNFSRKLPFHQFPIIWNKWVNLSTETKSRNQFKRRVKSSLLLNYPTRVSCSNTFCRDCY